MKVRDVLKKLELYFIRFVHKSSASPHNHQHWFASLALPGIFVYHKLADKRFEKGFLRVLVCIPANSAS